MNRKTEDEIRKANEKWLARDKPKRQKAKDNAWKRKGFVNDLVKRKAK